TRPSAASSCSAIRSARKSGEARRKRCLARFFARALVAPSLWYNPADESRTYNEGEIDAPDRFFGESDPSYSRRLVAAARSARSPAGRLSTDSRHLGAAGRRRVRAD